MGSKAIGFQTFVSFQNTQQGRLTWTVGCRSTTLETSEFKWKANETEWYRKAIAQEEQAMFRITKSSDRESNGTEFPGTMIRDFVLKFRGVRHSIKDPLNYYKEVNERRAARLENDRMEDESSISQARRDQLMSPSTEGEAAYDLTSPREGEGEEDDEISEISETMVVEKPKTNPMAAIRERLRGVSLESVRTRDEVVQSPWHSAESQTRTRYKARVSRGEPVAGAILSTSYGDRSSGEGDMRRTQPSTGYYGQKQDEQRSQTPWQPQLRETDRTTLMKDREAPWKTKPQRDNWDLSSAWGRQSERSNPSGSDAGSSSGWRDNRTVERPPPPHEVPRFIGDKGTGCKNCDLICRVQHKCYKHRDGECPMRHPAVGDHDLSNRGGPWCTYRKRNLTCRFWAAGEDCYGDGDCHNYHSWYNKRGEKIKLNEKSYGGDFQKRVWFGSRLRYGYGIETIKLQKRNIKYGYGSYWLCDKPKQCYVTCLF